MKKSCLVLLAFLPLFPEFCGIFLQPISAVPQVYRVIPFEQEKLDNIFSLLYLVRSLFVFFLACLTAQNIHTPIST